MLFFFPMPWIFSFEKSEYDADSETELLRGPGWENIGCSVAFMTVPWAAHV